MTLWVRIAVYSAKNINQKRIFSLNKIMNNCLIFDNDIAAADFCNNERIGFQI